LYLLIEYYPIGEGLPAILKLRSPGCHPLVVEL
jgi:hypothetical protein